MKFLMSPILFSKLGFATPSQRYLTVPHQYMAFPARNSKLHIESAYAFPKHALVLRESSRAVSDVRSG